MNNINKISLVIVISSLFSSFGYTKTTDSQLCEPPEGYMIGFFNGVWNTERQATDSLKAMENSLFDRSAVEKGYFKFELFYNQTSSYMDDLFETFSQRMQEQFDINLRNRWEIYWESLNGSSSQSDDEVPSFSTIIADVDPRLAESFEEWRQQVYDYTTIFIHPDTSRDTAIHANQIKNLITEKHKLILVAHSQGNLFVNRAYDAAMTLTDSNSVKVIHVAPASVRLNGPYVLADRDRVINAMRPLSGQFGPVPAANVELDFVKMLRYDISGHTFVDTYLNRINSAPDMIIGNINNAIATLVTPDVEGNSGFFTVSLSKALDALTSLIVIEPNSDDPLDVHGDVLEGEYGDMYNKNDRFSYYAASCDPERLTTGTWHVMIDSRPTFTTDATVQIYSNRDGELDSSIHYIIDEDDAAEIEDEQGENNAEVDGRFIRIADVIVYRDENDRLAVYAGPSSLPPNYDPQR